mgnify:CR=1 FL=1
MNSYKFDWQNTLREARKLKEAAKAFGVNAKSEKYKLQAEIVGENADADADPRHVRDARQNWYADGSDPRGVDDQENYFSGVTHFINALP